MTKTKSKVAAKRTPTFSTRLLALAVASCFSSAVYALGTAPTVVAGSATISQTGNVMTVTNSNGTIINWGALSVLSGEKLVFDQAANSSVLNRVIGMNINGKWVLDPTVIAGTISSRGSVWIINTSGVMVKQGAVIDVARFVGSTIDVSNTNFLAGKLLFDGTPGTGTVVVEKGASITTGKGGSVYLIGSNVTNNGIITTPEGETILAAGKSVSIVDTGTPGVKVEITGSEGNVTNLGTVLAEAGRIGMAGVLVRNSGTLNASSVVKEGGRIFLKASQDAYVDGDGRIVTTGTKGGKVEVLGNRVAVMDNASIDASGTNGGGTVLVGGDYQGKNSNVHNATVTYFGNNASIKADATGKGNGGKVILWANDTTRAFGSISVRGGANGGNGGFVETSGHRYLSLAGIRVDATAPLGSKGSWLLDPTDITINHGGRTSATFSAVGGPGGYKLFDTGNLDSSTLTDGDVNYYLSSSNVTISTSSSGSGYGDITVNNGVSITGPITFGSLSLIAARNIVMSGANIGVPNGEAGLNITLQAGGNISLTRSSLSSGFFGGMTMEAGKNIALTGSSLTSRGGTIRLTAGYPYDSGGNIAMSNSIINAGSGTVNLFASSGGIYDGNIAVDRVLGSTVNIYAEGAISDTNGRGVVNVTGDSIALTSFYGGVAGGKAIDLDVSVSDGGSLSAYVGEGAAQYGGISLRNYGADPSAGGGLNLTDTATYGNDLYYYGANGISALPTLSRDGNITIESGGNLTLGGTLSGSTISLTATGAVGTAIPVINGEVPRPGPLAPYGTTAIDAAGNVSVSASSLSLTSSILARGSLTLTTSGDMQLSSSTVQGSQVNLTAGGAMQLSGTTVRAYSSDLAIKAATSLTMNNATLQAVGDINLAAQSIRAVGSTIQSGYGFTAMGPTTGQFLAAGNVTMTANEDIVLNGTTVEAGNDVVFNLQGATSTLYLNDQAGMYSPSQVVSDIFTQVPATIHINFLSNTSGGVVIDGVNTTTTIAGGSGFYVLNSSTPARPGYGLSMVYPTIISGTTGQVATEIGAEVNKTTTRDNLSDTTSANDSPNLTTSAPLARSGSSEEEGGTFDSKDKKENSDSGDKKEQRNGKSTSKNQCS